MTNFFEPPANGDSPRKSWPFPASAVHRGAPDDRGLCSPELRAACDPRTATCANASACAESRHTPVLLKRRSGTDRPSA